MKKYKLILLSLIGFVGVSANAQMSTKESARAFVQRFYDKYSVSVRDVPAFIKKHNASPFAYTFKTHGEYFEKKLHDAIAAYFKAPLKDEIGLDFDPIINAQDDRNGYETADVRQKGNNFFVGVHDIQKGKNKNQVLSAEVSVIAEVTNANGQWKFVNFIYPALSGSNSDLLTILKSLKKEQQKS
ncbi:MAG TPA: hypothetical protein VG367_09120 [Mucilaginibacter sp.]|jgi:hypothetical protein|nr:hypothetical protein [Mucilaginibacter sp.]